MTTCAPFRQPVRAVHVHRGHVRPRRLNLGAHTTLPRIAGRRWHGHLEWLRSLSERRSEVDRRFLDTLTKGHQRLPDDAQKSIPDPRFIPDFFYEIIFCIFCDSAVYETACQRERGAAVRAA